MARLNAPCTTVERVFGKKKRYIQQSTALQICFFLQPSEGSGIIVRCFLLDLMPHAEQVLVWKKGVALVVYLVAVAGSK